MEQRQAIKITLHNYQQPLTFEACNYRFEDGDEVLLAYAANHLADGLARSRENDFGVIRASILRPSRRPYIGHRRVNAGTLFHIRPEAIASAEIITLADDQATPELPEDFIEQVVDRSAPSGEPLAPSELRSGRYYLASDQQGHVYQLYIRNCHPSGNRVLLEVVFPEGGQRVVNADVYQWRENDE